jgi:hypothetical protein
VVPVIPFVPVRVPSALANFFDQSGRNRIALDREGVIGVALIDFINIAKIRLLVSFFWKPRRFWEILDDRLARRLSHHFKAARDRRRASSWLADELRRLKQLQLIEGFS